MSRTRGEGGLGMHRGCATLEKAAESGHSSQGEDDPPPHHHPRLLPSSPSSSKKSMVLYIREEKVNR